MRALFLIYGSIAIIDRFFRHPEQVNLDNLKEVFKSGKFVNASSGGFQEGYYPSSEQIEKLFASNGFTKIKLLSIRGLGYEKEEQIYSIKDDRFFNAILNLISQTAEYKELIETCGHAMYIGTLK